MSKVVAQWEKANTDLRGRSNEKQVIIIEQQTKRIELLEQQVCDLRAMLEFLRKPNP